MKKNKTVLFSVPVQKLRVWWIPQVPGKPFYVPVDSVKEGRKLLEVLADYDAFQFENRIKPDYSNAGGLTETYEEKPTENDWTDIDEEDFEWLIKVEEEGSK